VLKGKCEDVNVINSQIVRFEDQVEREGREAAEVLYSVESFLLNCGKQFAVLK